ncbi:HSP20-like chaperone [Ascosphaera apis ARSEF 7405]|uniref:HSP20-like chaperone n=1 Tax=Ascosphaera apis ARSEF 7405 TaxID=392613 RepID=A0A167YH93_9EURO|nr:HSP20-like chaperone [Ascosphaera apis ARSEF 7405]
MAFYSFPVFTSDFYNPFASHQLLWDDEDDLRPTIRRRDNAQNNNSQLIKSNDGSSRNNRDSLLRVPKFIKSFAPKFDVRETKEGYHLDGELPGLKQKDVEIEFSDPHTLLVKGEVKREYHTTNAEDESEKEESTEAKDQNQTQAQTSEPPRQLHMSPHQATVEDTDENGNPIASPSPPITLPESKLSRKERAYSDDESGPATKKAKKHHHRQSRDLSPLRVKYWVSERTTGSFHRSFNFPCKVDQDNVKASLKDGLLSVFVPKQKEHKGRKKITIE